MKLLRRILNHFLHLLARSLPGSQTLRPLLHRLRGVKIYGSVFIGGDVYLENEYPSCVEIHDGAAIGLRSTIVAHTRGRGRVVIEKNAVAAAGCLIVCSSGKTLRIGEGSVVSAGSVVGNDIPPRTLCAPPRIKAIAEVTVPFTLKTSYRDFIRGLRPMGKGAKQLHKKCGREEDR